MAHDTPPKQVSSGENAEPAARPSNAKSEALTNHAQVTTDTPSPHPSSASPPSIPEHALLWRIGGGSYGEVWLARNRMETFRAVKIVHRKTFERDEHFEREFKGIQKFEPVSRSHEGLVDILQIGRGEGYFYYVMELADDAAKNPNDECQNPKEARNPKAKPSPTAHPLQASGFGIPSTFEIRHSAFYTPRTLRAEQQRHGRLPVAECVRIGLTLTSALAHLHKQGLVHRDVKPSNIIFVDGVTKLADIGLVVETSEAKSFVGTMGFIPPEGPGTPQADLYSLGKVLYEISTGKDRQDFPQLPAELLQGTTRASPAEMCIKDSLLSPSSSGGGPETIREKEMHAAEALIELNEVLLKACHKEVRQRYPSAEAMLADLELLQRGESVQRKRTRDRRATFAKKIGAPFGLLVVLLAELHDDIDI